MAGKDKPEIDEATGTETTGHEWDGIKELDTPLPKWWLYTFYGTVIWGLLYTVAYPAWPMIETATGGLIGYSTRGQVHEAMAEAAKAKSAWTDRIAALDIAEVAGDAELARFSMAGGAAVYRTNCSQCHGAGAAGVQAAGYPNLRDDAWLWGGSLEDIYHTVAHGIRNDQDPEARYSEMPAFGAMGLLDDAQIEAVAGHVLSLSGRHEPDAEGAAIFAEQCGFCHGERGEGMQAMGAPNLADAIWLYGGSKERVVESIHEARFGVMPPWAGRLDEAEIKQVAIYVHSLGGGE